MTMRSHNAAAAETPLAPSTIAIALAATLALAPAVPARAQTSTRTIKLHVFVPYGLDAELVRLDRIQRVDRIDGRPYVRTVDPGDGHAGYLLLTLTVKNDRPTRGYIPALVTTVRTDSGPAIDPAVYGPFVGNSTTQVDLRSTIPPHASATLHLAVIDIPNGHNVTSLILSPNDATAQYRFNLKPADITALPAVARKTEH